MPTTQEYENKQAPGKLRMKCMIWEPTPVGDRRRQEDTMVYNQTTLDHIQTVPQGSFHFLEDPSCFCLQILHVKRDTFLIVKNGDKWQNITTNQEKFLDFQSNKLFTTDGQPAKPWVWHQTFKVTGSIINPSETLSPSSLANQSIDTQGLSKWAYQHRNTGLVGPGDGHDGKNPVVDESLAPYVPASEKTQAKDENGQPKTAVLTDDEKEKKAFYESRKDWRFFPSQLQVSTESNYQSAPESTSSTSAKPKPKAIHWLVEKETDLFNQEDFFVEFIRQAYQPDIKGEKIPLSEQFRFLDPTRAPQPSGVTTGNPEGRPIIINSAVVEIGEDGLPKPDASNTIDLTKQPYYLVEIGPNQIDHHYYILLAYNSYPRFIHVGQVPFISVGALTPATDKDGTLIYDETAFFGDSGNSPPVLTPAAAVLVTPDIPISTVLSQYNRSCKELMDQETLRITVRNHMGSIVVYFNDDLTRPWFISRSDFDPKGQAQAQQSLGDMPKKPVYMRVPNDKIRLAAGNILSGFMFGPLHYKPQETIVLPDPVCVKGPVSDSLVNCLLREKQQRKVGSRQLPVYFQDADIYREHVNGQPTVTTKRATLDGSIAKNGETELFKLTGFATAKQGNGNVTESPSSRTFTGAGTAAALPASVDGKLSFITIEKTTPLSSTPGAQPTGGTAGSGSTATTSAPRSETVKFFRAKYTLGAGDVTVGKPDVAKKWLIPNCVTPIATGWTLLVEPSQVPRWVCPVFDVAHHVLNFNVTTSFTDQIKVERSGSIKFLINFGNMTGTDPNAQTGGLFECDPSIDEQNNPYAIDRSKMLASLVDKTFMIRVYAWWEGGYMSCSNNECWCKRDESGDNSKNRSVLFTGLIHGGQITVENGKRVMDCQLLDYWKILDDQMFLNSPFFDGMRDYNAVLEILQLAGFVSNRAADAQDLFPPASFIQSCADSQTGQMVSFIDPVTRDAYWIQDYALPSAFDVLQSPIMKFSDGSNYSEGIIQMARFGGKMVYFDRFGIFRMVARPDQWFCQPSHPMFNAKCNFFATPKDIPVSGCRGLDAVIFGNYTYKRHVSDVVNEIHIVSATPDGEMVIGSGVNLPGKTNPNEPGYIGYTKRLLQTDGIFGTMEAVERIVKYYSGAYKPPVSMTWTAMGTPRLSAGDIVTFTGLRLDDSFPPPTRPSPSNLPNKTTTLYLTSVTSEIDPSQNTWTNNYEGEWIWTGEMNCNQNQSGGQ